MNAGKVSCADLVGVLAKTHKITQQNVADIIHGKDEKGGLLNKIAGLQAEKTNSPVFGGNAMWWYWYTGDITLDGFTDSIVLDHELAEHEIAKWKEQMH